MFTILTPTLPAGTTLTDAALNVWTMDANGTVRMNGVAIANPLVVILTPTSGGSVTDAASNTWTLSSTKQVSKNGTVITSGNGTGALTVIGGVIYGQDDNSKLWYTWNNGTTWVTTGSTSLPASGTTGFSDFTIVGGNVYWAYYNSAWFNYVIATKVWSTATGVPAVAPNPTTFISAQIGNDANGFNILWNWSAVDFATHYSISFTDLTTGVVVNATTTDTSYTSTGTNNLNYSLQVISVNAAGLASSGFIGIGSTNRASDILSIAASNITANSVTLSWVPGTNAGMASFYGVYGTGGGQTAKSVYPGLATTCVVTGLKPGAIYEFQVGGLNYQGSGLTASIFVTTLA